MSTDPATDAGGPDSVVHEDPRAIDRTRYRVVIGEVGQFHRAVREYGALHVAGTDSLQSAYAWTAARLAEYTARREANRSAWGARAAVLEVDPHRESVTLVHSLHGYPVQLHTQVTQLISDRTPGDTADLAHPYRARFYNAEDRFTTESPSFTSEAAARVWLTDKAETFLSDGVEAAITRIDPTNGWPRPVLELGRQSHGFLFGASVSNDLTDLADAEAASFGPRAQQDDLLGPLLNAYRAADEAVQNQRSAHDRFIATVYRDRLLHLLDGAADEHRTAGFGHDHTARFPVLDSYQVTDATGDRPDWMEALIHQMENDRADALASGHRFVFFDEDDPSRMIEVTWHPERPGSYRRGWYATESVDTPDGPRLVAMLGRREDGLSILNMLSDPMTGFSATQPVQRPPVKVPQTQFGAIWDASARQRRFIARAEAVARQVQTLRQPLGTTSANLDNPRDSHTGTDTNPPFDLWRDALFPGMRVEDVAYNPAVWEIADNRTPTRRTLDPHNHREADADHGHRIAGLLDTAIRHRDNTSETTPPTTAADPVAEDTTTLPIDQQQPNPGHELD